MTDITIPYPKRWEVQRFWDENFKYDEHTGCLEWQKGLSKQGYGRVSLRNVLYFAHRFAYFLYYMEDPGEWLVRHLCHNRKCANPLHLTIGTHADNSQDMVDAGRSQTGENHWMQRMPERAEELRESWRERGRNLSKMNGRNHPTTKLTAEHVKEIMEQRALCGNDRKLIGECNRRLAEKFGVTHSNISSIALGKSGHCL